MSPDLVLWLALATKMAVVAAFVVGATVVAERFGPLLGAMVATLPISAGPAYLFLALDHDAAFVAATAGGSLVGNAVNVVFCLVYATAAQSRGLAASLAAATAAWFVLALLSQSVTWNVPQAVALNIAVFAAALPLSARYRGAAMRSAQRRWYDAPLRAAMVSAVVVSVVELSGRLGPALTGVVALYPVVLTSLALILQPRVGGPATAAIHANAIPGLAGFGLALLLVNRLAVPAGVAAALSLALAVSTVWNLVILLRRLPRRAPASAPLARD